MLSADLNEDWRRALAYHALGWLSPDQAIELAVRTVQEGVEAREVLDLAGEPSGQAWRDLAEPFAAAVASLGFKAMDVDEAEPWVIHEIAERVMLQGEDPVAASVELYDLLDREESPWYERARTMAYAWVRCD